MTAQRPDELICGHQADPIRIMGVEYVRLQMDNGDELYLTSYALPHARLLQPECFWTDREWSRRNRQRLAGTSTVYRVATRPVDGRSLNIVLKWNRMGQDVPGATGASDLASAEFNSPFEEFALALELREATGGPGRFRTHKPLAIFVPAEHLDWDRLGRRMYKLEGKQQLHREIQLHTHRNYAVLYEWIKGIDASEACAQGLLDQTELSDLTQRAASDMQAKGFSVRDNKPHHVIVRPDRSGCLIRRGGRIAYAYVDFELLIRTGQRDQQVRAEKRREYLVRQAHRFETTAPLPSNLHLVRVFGVDYVYGRIESTRGGLWTVGRDPALFEYFLPEKWRKTPRTKLSVTSQVYETTTKDNVRLVWRVSHVGEQPDLDPFKDDERRILTHGYNSPFEEVAMATELRARGIDAIYPRAIYRTGEAADMMDGLSDLQRYRSHQDVRTPDGRAVLEEGYDYILIWGYWNGPDELLAVKDDPPYVSLNALQAFRAGHLDEATYLRLMQATRERLARADIEDLNLRGSHLLVSLQPSGQLAQGPDGLPEVLICNFELLRKREVTEA